VHGAGERDFMGDIASALRAPGNAAIDFPECLPLLPPEILRQAGVIKTKHPVKILGDGELSAALTVHAHKFSKSAQEKITRAGGKFEVLQ